MLALLFPGGDIPVVQLSINGNEPIEYHLELGARLAPLPRLVEHEDFAAAAPTPDHFLPLLYLAGLAAAAGHATDVLVDGYAYGSLSMTSYTLGAAKVAVSA